MIIAWHTFETTLAASSSPFTSFNWEHFQVQTRNSSAGGCARAREKLFSQFSRVLLGRAPCGDDSILFDYFWGESNHKSSGLPMNFDWLVRNGAQLISQPCWVGRRRNSHNPRRKMWATLFSSRGRDCHDALARERRRCTTEPHIN